MGYKISCISVEHWLMKSRTVSFNHKMTKHQAWFHNTRTSSNPTNIRSAKSIGSTQRPGSQVIIGSLPTKNLLKCWSAMVSSFETQQYKHCHRNEDRGKREAGEGCQG